jgi:transposase-like protein
MSCPRGQSITTSERTKQTQLGYHPCFCQTCTRTFHERTGTSCNYREFPTDSVLLVVMWRLRYQLSWRDRAEMFLERGCAFTHAAVRQWEARFAPLVADQLRAQRQGQAGRSWQVDATYIQVSGVWNYRYRAIDRAGNRVASMRSEHRAMDAAQRCFQAALAIAEQVPAQVTTAGHGS